MHWSKSSVWPNDYILLTHTDAGHMFKGHVSMVSALVLISPLTNLMLVPLRILSS